MPAEKSPMKSAAYIALGLVGLYAAYQIYQTYSANATAQANQAAAAANSSDLNTGFSALGSILGGFGSLA